MGKVGDGGYATHLCCRCIVVRNDLPQNSRIVCKIGNVFVLLQPRHSMMLEKEIEEYELVRVEFQAKIADRMGQRQWMEYNEILFSAHSCAIEGNSFTVDDTRILREQGMAMIPVCRR